MIRRCRISSSPTAAWARSWYAAQHAADPLWSGLVLMEEPELVRDLHAEFIRAGARVITINTYAATPERLAREGAEELFETLQQRAIDLAVEAREAERGDDVLIAGCLSPLFGSYHPELTISFEETLDDLPPHRRRAGRCASISCCARRWPRPRRPAPRRSPRARAASPCGCRGRSPTIPARRGCAAASRSRRPRPRSRASARRAARQLQPARDGRRRARRLVALGGPVGAYANAFPAVGDLKHGGTVEVLGLRDDLGPAAYAEPRWAGSREGRRSSAAAARSGRRTSPRCATASPRRATRRWRRSARARHAACWERPWRPRILASSSADPARAAAQIPRDGCVAARESRKPPRSAHPGEARSGAVDHALAKVSPKVKTSPGATSSPAFVARTTAQRCSRSSPDAMLARIAARRSLELPGSCAPRPGHASRRRMPSERRTPSTGSCRGSPEPSARLDVRRCPPATSASRASR